MSLAGLRCSAEHNTLGHRRDRAVMAYTKMTAEYVHICT